MNIEVIYMCNTICIQLYLLNRCILIYIKIIIDNTRYYSAVLDIILNKYDTSFYI